MPLYCASAVVARRLVSSGINYSSVHRANPLYCILNNKEHVIISLGPITRLVLFLLDIPRMYVGNMYMVV